ncbi:MAG: toll/interleukin-1 receptor domain-containing protein [Chloroflexi bacterium]|nr:MAG: hypothetical protein CUN54_02700 [Phototrophicales bacterium]RMF80880.1 MAG: toll/interleukin-1 receptor domain-containing protein [Chloroflexota bacterium]
MTLEEFITKVTQRPLPNDRMARVHTMAKELAEGALEGLWLPSFEGRLRFEYSLNQYVEKRWGSLDEAPPLPLLEVNGFLQPAGERSYKITSAAFELLSAAPTSSIFISYKRSESSAFALLVLARLKQEGLDAFLDLTLEPGEDWHSGLKQRVQQRDYFISILAPTTLQSEVVLEEITWAIESNAVIIPIWHNGFVYNEDEWDIPAAINVVLSNTHTIRVLEESALAYNNAIVELLNKFGVTPG